MNTVMYDIEQYGSEDANWQAIGVYAVILGNWRRIKSPRIARCIGKRIDTTLLPKEYNAKIKIGRFNNCREQGYVFTLWEGGKQLKHYAVYEHRNSDELIVMTNAIYSEHTPPAEFIFGGRGKYDYDKKFNCGEIVECANWIMDDMCDMIEAKYADLQLVPQK